MKTKKEIEEKLGMFFGTENYYKMGLSGKMVATDGVSYLANAAECFWLIEIILSVQHLSKIKNETFSDMESFLE